MSQTEQIANEGSSPKSYEGDNDLEARLNQKPTLDTDLREFLVIAGLDYYYSPLHKPGNEHLHAQAKERYQKRKAPLTKKQKITEGKIRGSLICAQYYHDKYRTIRDLKEYIETKGVNMKNVGYMTIAALNGILKEYGIESIRIGKTYGYDKAIRSAGLEIIERS